MNDGRVRDLEFRVKDLQGEIKALKKKLANIVYVVIGYHPQELFEVEDIGGIYLYDSLDKAEEVVRIWEESNPHEYSHWEILEKEVE